MSVVPTELTSGTLLKKAQPLFRHPLQTSSFPLFESISPLFLTMSGIPALNLNLPIFNSSWHLDQPQSITTNTISCLDQYRVMKYTEVLHPCVGPNRLSLTAFCVSDVRPTRSNVPRTAPVNVNAEVINAARQILRAQTHHVYALES